eukprot:10842496-Lingulodinium_polyedra.AAC.1
MALRPPALQNEALPSLRLPCLLAETSRPDAALELLPAQVPGAARGDVSAKTGILGEVLLPAGLE